MAPEDKDLVLRVFAKLTLLHDHDQDLPCELFIDSCDGAFYVMTSLGYKRNITLGDMQELKDLEPHLIREVYFNNNAEGIQNPELAGGLCVEVAAQRNDNQQNAIMASQAHGMKRPREDEEESPLLLPVAAVKRRRKGMVDFLGSLLFGAAGVEVLG